MFSFTLWETCFGFYNLEQLSLNARRSSYLLAFVGVVFAMVQGGGIKAFTKRASEGKITLFSFFVLAISLVLWSNSYSIATSMVSLFPLGLSSGLLNTLINSEITRQVEQSELGGTLGLSAAVGSLTRVVAPITSGFLIDQFGITAPGTFGAILMALTGCYMYLLNVHQRMNQKSKAKE